MRLAAIAFRAGKKLFKLRPKVHMLAEIGLSLSGWSLSPHTSSCWSDEDFVGRVSRVARSCHGATLSISCMRKCLGFYNTQFAPELSQEARLNRNSTRRCSRQSVMCVVCRGACVSAEV